MSLDCISCTGHWKEKGKEQDSAAEAHSCWVLQQLTWELWAAASPRCPNEPSQAPHSAGSQGCPQTALGLQRHQEGRADVPLPRSGEALLLLAPLSLPASVPAPTQELLPPVRGHC